MRKRTLVITSLVGVSGVAVCVPDINAYRRLAAIARSVREVPSTAPAPAAGDACGRLADPDAHTDD